MPQKISYTILTPRTGFIAYVTELNDIKSTTFLTDFCGVRSGKKKPTSCRSDRGHFGLSVFFSKNRLGTLWVVQVWCANDSLGSPAW